MRVFRVQDVNIEYSAEDGISFDCAFQNYLVVREEEQQEAHKLGAGEAAAALAGLRDDATSNELRTASADNRTLSSQAQSGDKSPEEFSSEGAESDERQKQAVQQRRTL